MAVGVLGGPLLGFLALISVAFAASAANLRPISDAHRSAALELFVPIDGSFSSLEETYEALRTFQILGVDKTSDMHHGTCTTILEKLGSLASKPKDYFDALRANNILGCQIGQEILGNIESQLQYVLKNADSLLDFYYSVLSLSHLKVQGVNVVLSDADGIFHSIKALSLSDGRWRYDSNNAESSTFAAGLALEALAGVISLADSKMDQSKIGVIKHGIVKLFDSTKSYDDGTLYFDEKHIDSNEYRGPLATTASVVRGVTAFAAATSGKLNIPGDKIVGLSKFFLSIGVPGTAKDLFHQIDSLSCLEDNRISIPLILSLPSTVFSLTSKDLLKVEVTTVLGSSAPPLTVSLVQARAADSKENSVIENQELNFDAESNVHYLDILPLNIDVGKYKLDFEISLHDPEHLNTYVTGRRTTVVAFLTGSIKVDKAEIGVLDSDAKSTATMQKLDLSKDSMVHLSANHLQKMLLAFQLMTPHGHIFKPHQVFLKLRHESKVEHIFTVGNSGKQFEIELVKFVFLLNLNIISNKAKKLL